jgi:hypothetical protein
MGKIGKSLEDAFYDFMGTITTEDGSPCTLDHVNSSKSSD